MAQHEWDGVERRQTQRRRTPTAEEVAAVIEAEKLSSTRYRRHRIATVIASIVATILISIPISIGIGHDIRTSARENSLANCASQAASRPVGNGRDFAERQLLRIADDAFRQFPAQFQHAENARINRELAAARRAGYVPDNAPHAVKGFGDLAVLLNYLPAINCGQQVSG